MKVLIINGPNLNLLSKRNKDLYGGIDFDYHLSNFKKEFKKISIKYYQSNIEGEIIDELQKYGFSYKYILLNAGGYTHTSVAIRDTIDLIESKVIEIHMTNIYARENFRNKSLISEKCYATFCGLGINTYRAALFSISP
jgi:3-dehydroquinate dehydratase-2